jgi:hypothetical protein
VYDPQYLQYAEKTWTAVRPVHKLTDETQWTVSNMRFTLQILTANVFFLERKYSTDKKLWLEPYAQQTWPKLQDEKEIAGQRSWQAFNYGEYQAYLVIKKYHSQFARMKILLEDMDTRQHEWNHNLENSASTQK